MVLYEKYTTGFTYEMENDTFFIDKNINVTNMMNVTHMMNVSEEDKVQASIFYVGYVKVKNYILLSM